MTKNHLNRLVSMGKAKHSSHPKPTAKAIFREREALKNHYKEDKSLEA